MRGFVGTGVSLTACCLLTACNHAPSQNLLGSYFPSWMICALIGLLGTIVCRMVLIKAGIDAAIPGKLFVYVAFVLSSTFVVWLSWFGN